MKSLPPRAGDRVRVPGHGEGLVVRVRPGGRVQVRFDRAPELPWTVDAGDCEAILDIAGRPDAPAAPVTRRAAPASARRAPPNPIESAELRQTVEAIRLGIVPARHVRRYTVGREDETRALDRLLAERFGLRVVWGDYGAGKTHFLDIAEQKALEEGFVAARIVVDPRESKVTNPKRLYESIAAALTYPDGSGQGMESLMRRLVDSDAHRSPEGASFSRFFSPYLHALHARHDEAIDWMSDYLGGYSMDAYDLGRALHRAGWRGPQPLLLSDYRTYGRMYVHMLGTLAAWSRDAGFSGLVLLIDEVEFVDDLNRENRRWAVEVLSHVAAISCDEDALGFDPESLYRGGQPVHQALPLRFRDDLPLVSIFALTMLPDIRSLMDSIVADPELSIVLRTLGRKDLPVLIDRITSLYADAYPDFTVDSGVVADSIERVSREIHDGQSGARQMVRAAVGLLDDVRWRHWQDARR